METLNYIICSAVLVIGIALFLTDNICLILVGFLWLVLNLRLSTNNRVRRMWKSYIKSTIKLEKKLGMY